MTAFEAWASQAGQIGNGARDPSPTFTGLVAPRSGMGHEDQFAPSGPGGRCRFGQATFTGTHGNERDAPQAVALCEIIATAIVIRFSDYSETQPIAVKLGRA